MDTHPGLAECVNCPHPRAAHSPLADAECRLGGCPCPGFRSPGTQSDAPVTGSRRVCVDVPDGYALTVELVPVGASRG